ncbi:hypothetical protein ACFFQF_20915 [Haladaptatus pallidirubidus]|uniref:Uncharacterized protein n=1 Tax=Haladaptatus pallidirubidus TaxID=1008152 RepID=A0AAV3UGQ3_9EURY|nr:hypothetical protein [Haladaptatus pallidirubidus]
MASDSSQVTEVVQFESDDPEAASDDIADFINEKYDFDVTVETEQKGFIEPISTTIIISVVGSAVTVLITELAKELGREAAKEIADYIREKHLKKEKSDVAGFNFQSNH